MQKISKISSLVSVAAAALITASVGSPAWGADCVVQAAVSGLQDGTNWGATGTGSCTVGPVSFSNVVISPIVTGTGLLVLGNIQPFIVDNEFGLSLTYSSTAGSSGTVDLAWTYNVTSSIPLVDALLALAGSVTAPGVLTAENLDTKRRYTSSEWPGLNDHDIFADKSAGSTQG